MNHFDEIEVQAVKIFARWVVVTLIVLLCLLYASFASAEAILLKYKGPLEIITEQYNLVAYTLVSETGHPAKVVTLGTFSSERRCVNAMRNITDIMVSADNQVGFFCIEKQKVLLK